MVRVRIIKTTKYAHVKDGEVADSIAVEHNVLATFFPTLFHRRRTESNRTADGIRSDGGRNLIGRRTRTVAHLGGALVSARLCRLPEQEVHQPSKSCTNRARSAPTEQELRPLQAPSVVTFSHRTHRTHRIYCCVFSQNFTETHRLLGCGNKKQRIKRMKRILTTQRRKSD